MKESTNKLTIEEIENIITFPHNFIVAKETANGQIRELAQQLADILRENERLQKWVDGHARHSVNCAMYMAEARGRSCYCGLEEIQHKESDNG